MADKLDDKGFLQRWSVRKLEDRAVVPPENESVVAEAKPETPPTDQPPPDLPDVEALDAESDYTAFLGENVPQDLAKMALRKLWRSDPVLANVDGLNDYDEDFSKVGMVTEVVKTVYQAGKGYLTAAEEESTTERDAKGMNAPENEMEEDASVLAAEDADALDATQEDCQLSSDGALPTPPSPEDEVAS